MTILNTNTISQNLVPTEPSLRDLLDLFKKDILLSLNCHHIGTIKVFNPLNQTAIVSINYNKTYFEFDQITNTYLPKGENYPLLADCPVICLGGGLSSLTFPILPGDECLVLFNDRDLDNWFIGGTGAPNATARLHSFSDGIIIVGIRSLPHVLSNYDPLNVVLKNGPNANAKIGLTSASLNYSSLSQVEVSALETTLSYGDASCTADTTSASLNYSSTSQVEASATAASLSYLTSEVSVAEKITISNSTADLLTILTNLNTVLTTVVNSCVTAGVIDPTTGAGLITTLTTTSVDIGALFS